MTNLKKQPVKKVIKEEKEFLLVDFSNSLINGPYNMLKLQNAIDENIENCDIPLDTLSVVEVGTGKVYMLDKKVTYILKS